MKEPIIKKDKKYFNTLTNKYVSEAYAKRINSYFKRNPKSNLIRASGHAVYRRKRPIYEHEQTMKKKLYGKGFQVYKTKSIEGKDIYYSPVYNKELSQNEIDYVKKLDYRLKENIFVELYRMSRDKERVYHLLTWTVNKSFNSSRLMELWIPHAEKIYMKIEKEMKKIIKKYPMGYSKLPIIYVHVANLFYSDMDYFEKGKSFGFYISNADGFTKLHNDFLETLAFYVDKLEIMAYHNILVQKFTFYIMDFYKTGSIQEIISKYRMGINRPNL